MASSRFSGWSECDEVSDERPRAEALRYERALAPELVFFIYRALGLNRVPEILRAEGMKLVTHAEFDLVPDTADE